MKEKPISEIEKKIERSHDKIIEWIKEFEQNGLKGLERILQRQRNYEA